MTVQELMAANAALAQFGERDMPVAAALAVAKVRRRVLAVLEPYQNVHDDVVRRLSGGKEQITAEDEGWPEYVRAAQELMATEVGEEIAPAVVSLDGWNPGHMPPNLLLALVPVLELE